VSSPYNPYPQGGDPGGGYGQSPYQPFPQGSSGWEPGTQRGYLQGGPAGFGEAVSGAFRNIFTYSGRASRSAYWWFVLFNVIVNIVLDFVERIGAIGVVIGAIVGIVMFFTALALAARRLHDSGRSGFWLFLILLPVIGWIWLLVYYLLPGTPGPNKFG
jgi:uncharacterized membrane protein YhaH (DUF805 family)